MAKVRFEEMFPWEVARAVAEAPICYLPLGVLEWHGEHAAVGLDGIKAQAVCDAAARRSGGVVVPAIWWGADEREDLPDGSYLTGGIEAGERYHVPGSMFWIRPETFRDLLLDAYEAMRRRGFRAIVVVAGHWSPRVYLPTVRASGAAFAARHPEVGWLMLTDQEVVPDLDYRMEHAAGGETSLLMAIRPDLVDLDKTFETDRSLSGDYAHEPGHLARRRETPHRYIGLYTGADDGSNDPETSAGEERGRVLLDPIGERIAARATALLAEAHRSPASHEPGFWRRSGFAG
ncbi:MAG: creatininase family protein [Chloroflexota bacterium]|nr:creatininase family protein [Chloroflexota bacterium]